MGLFLPGDKRTGFYIDYEVAQKLGINCAIILGRIIFWLEKHINENDRQFFKDGRWWAYESVTSLSEYSTLGRFAVKRTIAHLRSLQIIDTVQYGIAAGEMENWYWLDKEKLAEILKIPPIGAKPTSGGDRSKTDQWVGAKPTSGGVQNRPISLIDKTKRLTKKTDNVTPLPLKSRRSKKELDLKFEPEDLDLAKPWLEFALKESSYKNPPKSWAPENFADGIRKVRTSTEYEGRQINHWGMRAVFEFIVNSKFWKRVAWSPEGLLKKNDEGVRKIDNILRQMKPESLRQEEKIKSWAPITEEELNNPFG